MKKIIAMILVLMLALSTAAMAEAYTAEIKKALEAVPGVRRLTPHCCRHTYVSQMQALGVDLATIQSIVGHADVDMTKHYLHVQRDVQERAIQRFSEMFSDTGNHKRELA